MSQDSVLPSGLPVPNSVFIPSFFFSFFLLPFLSLSLGISPHVFPLSLQEICMFVEDKTTNNTYKDCREWDSFSTGGKKNLILILSGCSRKDYISAVITDFFLYSSAHTHSTSFWSVYTEMGWNVAQFYKYLICNYILLALTTSFYLFSAWKFLSLGFRNTNRERSSNILL